MAVSLVGSFEINDNAYATPFFENGHFTSNGIEWCQENLQLYEILGEKFFEHHKHSLESRVCASLYEDPLWSYDGPDRTQKLIEKSLYYSQLEISESMEESKTGFIDTTPAANRDETLVRGMTENGEITVQLIADKAISNTPMQIDVSFLNRDNSLTSNVNYQIEATQQDSRVMLNNGYSENGRVTLSTLPLLSDEPVNISVTIKGIGLPENQEYWTPPNGDVIMFTIVPEFGTLVMMILIVSIISSIILSKHTLFENLVSH
jgi:predicted secreted protein with PEFG-CTERM motif